MDELLTIDDLAEKLGVCKRTVYRLLKDNRLTIEVTRFTKRTVRYSFKVSATPSK